MIYEKELSDRIIGCAIAVHKELGAGYLEKVYERALCVEFKYQDINFESQVPIQVFYRNQIVGDYFADIIVDSKIILELKACNVIHPLHSAQIMNYLTATGIKVGYILSFGNEAKLEFKRIVH
ncbi:MAG: GxxExxY protein [Candidatus Cloacimonas sp.]|nr:GxxExxY protein [Candidatus Cloacimonas sp.]